MTVNRPTLSGSVSRDAARSVSKLLLAAVSLGFVLYLFTLLPGIDRIVPLTPITFVALVGAIATVVLVALILYATPKLASLTRMALDGPKVVVENLASVVYWLGVLAAVLVAHRGLAGAIGPFLGRFGWLYDVVFLVLSIPSVAFIAVRLYATVDPGADLLADKIAENGTESDDEAINASDAVSSDEKTDRKGAAE